MSLSHEPRASEALAHLPLRHPEPLRHDAWHEPHRHETARHPVAAAAVLPLPSARPAELEELVPANDLASLERRVGLLAVRPGVRVRRLGWVAGWPLHALRVRPCAAPVTLRVVVTAGVHGIEPAGPAAVMLLVEQMLATPERFGGIELTAVPLVNPVGYHTRTRGNADRLDLNRSFGSGASVPREVALVRGVLAEGPYHLGVDLHSSRSSGERGYFALHRDALDLVAPAMRRFGARWPILCESTDRYVLDAAGVLRSSNRGTLKDFLADDCGVRWSVTIEAPAAAPYASQVRGSADVVETLIGTARELL